MAGLVAVLFAVAGGTLGRGDGPSFIGQERLQTPAPVVSAPQTTVADAPLVPETVSAAAA
jgi:hypothetical protein